MSFRKLLSLILAVLISITACPTQGLVWANESIFLPVPGQKVLPSIPKTPIMLKGIKTDPKNPLRFDFILHQDKSSVIASDNTASAGGGSAFGGKQSNQEQLSAEGGPAYGWKTDANRLIKYFLANLAIPEDDLWVNLSPYEKDRMIPDSLGKTELGRDLLAQDYVLKQLTASLLDPQTPTGKEFWYKIYTKAQQQYGTTNIPVDTYNKVWVLADNARIFQKNNAVYVLDAHMKIMTDTDYLAEHKNNKLASEKELSNQILKDLILPAIEKEVNTGENFAPLRQMYHAFILASWYKKNLKQSILNQYYADKKKVTLLASSKSSQPKADPPTADIGDPAFIYKQYLKAFKKGVVNLIQEDKDPITHQVVPRKYFSGGTKFHFDHAQTVPESQLTSIDYAAITNANFAVTVDVKATNNSDQALVVSAATMADQDFHAVDFVLFFAFLAHGGNLDLPYQIFSLNTYLSALLDRTPNEELRGIANQLEGVIKIFKQLNGKASQIEDDGYVISETSQYRHELEEFINTFDQILDDSEHYIESKPIDENARRIVEDILKTIPEIRRLLKIGKGFLRHNLEQEQIHLNQFLTREWRLKRKYRTLRKEEVSTIKVNVTGEGIVKANPIILDVVVGRIISNIQDYYDKHKIVPAEPVQIDIQRTGNGSIKIVISNKISTDAIKALSTRLTGEDQHVAQPIFRLDSGRRAFFSGVALPSVFRLMHKYGYDIHMETHGDTVSTILEFTDPSQISQPDVGMDRQILVERIRIIEDAIDSFSQRMDAYFRSEFSINLGFIHLYRDLLSAIMTDLYTMKKKLEQGISFIDQVRNIEKTAGNVTVNLEQLSNEDLRLNLIRKKELVKEALKAHREETKILMGGAEDILELIASDEFNSDVIQQLRIFYGEWQTIKLLIDQLLKEFKMSDITKSFKSAQPNAAMNADDSRETFRIIQLLRQDIKMRDLVRDYISSGSVGATDGRRIKEYNIDHLRQAISIVDEMLSTQQAVATVQQPQIKDDAVTHMRRFISVYQHRLPQMPPIFMGLIAFGKNAEVAWNLGSTRDFHRSLAGSIGLYDQQAEVGAGLIISIDKTSKELQLLPMGLRDTRVYVRNSSFFDVNASNFVFNPAIVGSNKLFLDFLRKQIIQAAQLLVEVDSDFKEYALVTPGELFPTLKSARVKDLLLLEGRLDTAMTVYAGNSLGRKNSPITFELARERIREVLGKLPADRRNKEILGVFAFTPDKKVAGHIRIVERKDTEAEHIAMATEARFNSSLANHPLISFSIQFDKTGQMELLSIVPGARGGFSIYKDEAVFFGISLEDIPDNILKINNKFKGFLARQIYLTAKLFAEATSDYSDQELTTEMDIVGHSTYKTLTDFLDQNKHLDAAMTTLPDPIKQSSRFIAYHGLKRDQVVAIINKWYQEHERYVAGVLIEDKNGMWQLAVGIKSMSHRQLTEELGYVGQYLSFGFVLEENMDVKMLPPLGITLDRESISKNLLDMKFFQNESTYKFDIFDDPQWFYNLLLRECNLITRVIADVLVLQGKELEKVFVDKSFNEAFKQFMDVALHKGMVKSANQIDTTERFGMAKFRRLFVLQEGLGTMDRPIPMDLAVERIKNLMKELPNNKAGLEILGVFGFRPDNMVAGEVRFVVRDRNQQAQHIVMAKEAGFDTVRESYPLVGLIIAYDEKGEFQVSAIFHAMNRAEESLNLFKEKRYQEFFGVDPSIVPSSLWIPNPKFNDFLKQQVYLAATLIGAAMPQYLDKELLIGLPPHPTLREFIDRREIGGSAKLFGSDTAMMAHLDVDDRVFRTQQRTALIQKANDFLRVMQEKRVGLTTSSTDRQQFIEGIDDFIRTMKDIIILLELGTLVGSDKFIINYVDESFRGINNAIRFLGLKDKAAFKEWVSFFEENHQEFSTDVVELTLGKLDIKPIRTEDLPQQHPAWQYFLDKEANENKQIVQQRIAFKGLIDGVRLWMIQSRDLDRPTYEETFDQMKQRILRSIKTEDVRKYVEEQIGEYNKELKAVDHVDHYYHPFYLLIALAIYAQDQLTDEKTPIPLFDQDIMASMQELLDVYNANSELFNQRLRLQGEKAEKVYFGKLDFPLLMNVAFAAYTDDYEHVLYRLSQAIRLYPDGEMKDKMAALDLILMGMHLQSAITELDGIDFYSSEATLKYVLARLTDPTVSPGVQEMLENAAAKLLLSIVHDESVIHRHRDKINIVIVPFAKALGSARIESMMQHLYEKDNHKHILQSFIRFRLIMNTAFARVNMSGNNPTDVILDWWKEDHQRIIQEFYHQKIEDFGSFDVMSRDDEDLEGHMVSNSVKFWQEQLDAAMIVDGAHRDNPMSWNDTVLALRNVFEKQPFKKKGVFAFTPLRRVAWKMGSRYHSWSATTAGFTQTKTQNKYSMVSYGLDEKGVIEILPGVSTAAMYLAYKDFFGLKEDSFVEQEGFSVFIRRQIYLTAKLIVEANPEMAKYDFKTAGVAQMPMNEFLAQYRSWSEDQGDSAKTLEPDVVINAPGTSMSNDAETRKQGRILGLIAGMNRYGRKLINRISGDTAMVSQDVQIDDLTFNGLIDRRYTEAAVAKAGVRLGVESLERQINAINSTSSLQDIEKIFDELWDLRDKYTLRQFGVQESGGLIDDEAFESIVRQLQAVWEKNGFDQTFGNLYYRIIDRALMFMLDAGLLIGRSYVLMQLSLKSDLPHAHQINQLMVNSLSSHLKLIPDHPMETNELTGQNLFVDVDILLPHLFILMERYLKRSAGQELVIDEDFVLSAMGIDPNISPTPQPTIKDYRKVLRDYLMVLNKKYPGVVTQLYARILSLDSKSKWYAAGFNRPWKIYHSVKARGVIAEDTLLNNLRVGAKEFDRTEHNAQDIFEDLLREELRIFRLSDRPGPDGAMLSSVKSFDLITRKIKDYIDSPTHDEKSFQAALDIIKSQSRAVGLTGFYQELVIGYMEEQIEKYRMHVEADWDVGGIKNHQFHPFYLVLAASIYFIQMHVDSVNLDDDVLFKEFQGLVDMYNEHQRQKTAYVFSTVDVPMMLHLSLAAYTQNEPLLLKLSKGFDNFKAGKLKDQIAILDLMLMGVHLQSEIKYEDLDEYDRNEAVDIDAISGTLAYIEKRLNDPTTAIETIHDFEMAIGKFLYSFSSHQYAIQGPIKGKFEAIILPFAKRLGIERIKIIFERIKDNDLKSQMPLMGLSETMNTIFAIFNTTANNPTEILVNSWSPTSQAELVRFNQKRMELKGSSWIIAPGTIQTRYEQGITFWEKELAGFDGAMISDAVMLDLEKLAGSADKGSWAESSLPQELADVDVGALPHYFKVDAMKKMDAHLVRDVQGKGQISASTQEYLDQFPRLPLTPPILAEISALLIGFSYKQTASLKENFNMSVAGQPLTVEGNIWDGARQNIISILVEQEIWRMAGENSKEGDGLALSKIYPTVKYGHLETVGTVEWTDDNLKSFLKALQTNEPARRAYQKIADAYLQWLFVNGIYQATWRDFQQDTHKEAVLVVPYYEVQVFPAWEKDFPSSLENYTERFKISDFGFFGMRSIFLPTYLATLKPNRLPKEIVEIFWRMLKDKQYVLTKWHIDLIYQSLSAARAQGIGTADAIWKELRQSLVSYSAKKSKDGDKALTTRIDPTQPSPGGVAFNAQDLHIQESGGPTLAGQAVHDFSVDADTLAQFQSPNFRGVNPVIIRITPINGAAQLLGIN